MAKKRKFEIGVLPEETSNPILKKFTVEKETPKQDRLETSEPLAKKPSKTEVPPVVDTTWRCPLNIGIPSIFETAVAELATAHKLDEPYLLESILIDIGKLLGSPNMIPPDRAKSVELVRPYGKRSFSISEASFSRYKAKNDPLNTLKKTECVRNLYVAAFGIALKSAQSALENRI